MVDDFAEYSRQLYSDVLQFVEENAPPGVVRNTLYRLRELKVVTVPDIVDGLTQRFEALFRRANREAWDAEWDSVRADVVRRLDTGASWEHPGVGPEEPDTESPLGLKIAEAHAALLHGCCEHIGRPGLLLDLGTNLRVEEVDPDVGADGTLPPTRQ